MMHKAACLFEVCVSFYILRVRIISSECEMTSKIVI